jgi:hypothetical protein
MDVKPDNILITSDVPDPTLPDSDPDPPWEHVSSPVARPAPLPASHTSTNSLTTKPLPSNSSSSCSLGGSRANWSGVGGGPGHAGNLCLPRRLRFVLCDFGLACKLEPDLRTAEGDARYVPHEALEDSIALPDKVGFRCGEAVC